ncbi:MAG: flavin reductase family protein [Gemmobacter sp.]
MTVDPGAFRAATHAFAGCVSVLTADEGGRRSGLIVMSTLALSTDPPLLLACVNVEGSAWPLITGSGAFGWSMLGADHTPVAQRFATAKGADRLDGATWETAETGAPLLSGAPAAFDCRVEDAIPKGAQAILIGRVVAIRQTAGKGALLWWQGGFRPLTA